MFLIHTTLIISTLNLETNQHFHLKPFWAIIAIRPQFTDRAIFSLPWRPLTVIERTERERRFYGCWQNRTVVLSLGNAYDFDGTGGKCWISRSWYKLDKYSYILHFIWCIFLILNYISFTYKHFSTFKQAV